MLVVLIIVMAITITALGFMSQSDVELACGQNMVLRTQMDYLAESGLEHARGLILNPQDVSAEYWTGGPGLQLVSGSNDRYDVTVSRVATDRCNYIIDCSAYREKGAERVGLSRLQAQLRLDPCIAYWVGSSVTVWPQMTIKGDVYCEATLTNNGSIDGDVFAVDAITGTGITGRRNESVTPGYPVVWPGLAIATTYYIGSTPYSAEPNLPSEPSNPSPNNPAGIRYCVGDVNMPGNVIINGTLVVTGKLTVSGANTITAVKNFPALLVGGQVVMKDDSSLEINGLAQINGPITFDSGVTTANLQVTGGLFINSGGIEGIASNTVRVNVTAAPAIAAIEIWLAPDTPKRWEPAAGAFFKSIERIP